MKSKAKHNRILAVLAAVFLAVFALFAPVQAVAQAEDTAGVQSLDDTKVDADLSSVINSAKMQAIRLKNSVQVVSFQEYCYSDEYPIYEEYYGLYVYIYTPEWDKKPLATEYNQNKVNMVVADIGTSAPDYENVPLQYLGTSEVYKNELHKFKVLFTAKEKIAFLAEVKEYAKAHDGVRRYDIASFQLTHTNGMKTDTSELNATNESLTDDRLFSKTLYFSGYGVGMSEATSGEGASSTLTCKYDELETLEISLTHTNYRGLDFNENNICDSLDSVYFSVPENYFTDYGGLQKIEAEWYEYKTKPIFVTSDKSAYDALKSYVGKDIGEHTDIKSLPYRVLWEEYLAGDGSSNSDREVGFLKMYNGEVESFDISAAEDVVWNKQDWEYVSVINWIFWKENITQKSDYKVSPEDVKTWAQNYAKEYPTKGYINGKYAQELFEDSIDEDRIQYLENPSAKRGYMKVVVDADAAEDKVNLLEKQEQGFWSKFWHGAKFDANTYDPIVVITADDIAGLNATTFAEKYLISKVFAQQVFDECAAIVNEKDSNGKTKNRFVLFRFAVTDYYSSDARFDLAGDRTGLFNNVINLSDKDGYVAQETVFTDFDVISLTFRSADDQVDTVIGVCSDPIDIFPGLDESGGLGDDNNELAALIAGIIIIVILIVGLVIVGVYFPGVGNMLLTGAGTAAKGIGAGLKFVGEGIKFVAVSIKDGFVAMFDGTGGKKKK